MTMTLEQLYALAPILLVSATIVVVMLAIAFKRNHWWNATTVVIGLNLALLSCAWLMLNLDSAQVVTPLFIVDGYALFYMGLIIATTLATATLSHAYFEGFKGEREELYLLLALSSLGGLTLACAQHFAALFIGLELMSVPLYAMIAYPVKQRHALEGGLKYLVLSAMASAFLLFGIALIYSQCGVLSFDLVGAFFVAGGSPVALLGGALLLIGIGFKLSLVPFHLWTPDVYEGAPAPVAAFLATASKVAVFAVMVRLFQISPAASSGVLSNVLTIIAIASILFGNLLALTQSNLKRLLGYSSIAHFGYLLIALVASKGLAVEAIGVYLVTYVITSLGAFGVITLMSSPYNGRDADALYEYRGLFWRRPYLTAVLTVMMLSLAGIPLTAGFIGKFYIIATGVESHQWWLVASLVLGSAIGVFYYLRVMVTLYLIEPNLRRHDAQLHWEQRAGGVMLLAIAVLAFFLGLYPQPLLNLVQQSGLAG